MTEKTRTPAEGTAEFYEGHAKLIRLAMSDTPLESDRRRLIADALAVAFGRGAASRASPEEGRLREALAAAADALWNAWQMLSAISRSEPSRDRNNAAMAASRAASAARHALDVAALRSPPEPTTTEDEGRGGMVPGGWLDKALTDARRGDCPLCGAEKSHQRRDPCAPAVSKEGER